MSKRSGDRQIRGFRVLFRKYGVLISVLAATLLPIVVTSIHYLRQEARIGWASTKGATIYLAPDSLGQKLPGGVSSRIRRNFTYPVAEPVTLATEIARPFVDVVGIGLWNEATDEDLRRLSRFTRTERLFLFEAKVTDEGMTHVAKFSGLKYLSLISNRDVTAKGLEHLRGLTGLKSIRFGNSMTDEFLALLPDCFPALSELTINGQITEEGLAHLSRLTHLEELEFFGSGLKGPGLVHLRGLPKLKKLTLDQNELTSEGLTHLDGLPALRELRIRSERGISDESLVPLASCPALEQLSLSSMKITDEGLIHLSRIATLEKLVLSRLQVTDEGVTRLSQATQGRIARRGQPWFEISW